MGHCGHATDHGKDDPRFRTSRLALQSAFIVLALQRRYDEIRIEDILQAAGVGRSTFYEHYAGKNALLVACMDDALGLLARTPFGEADIRRLGTLLDHFRCHGTLAHALFHGSPSRVVRNAVVTRVEATLDHGGCRLRLPNRLAAHALADGMLSPVAAWLSHEAACDACALAAALVISSQAMLHGFTTPD